MAKTKDLSNCEIYGEVNEQDFSGEIECAQESTRNCNAFLHPGIFCKTF